MMPMEVSGDMVCTFLFIHWWVTPCMLLVYMIFIFDPLTLYQPMIFDPLTLYQPVTHICVMSSHKPIRIYMGV